MRKVVGMRASVKERGREGKRDALILEREDWKE